MSETSGAPGDIAGEAAFFDGIVNRRRAARVRIGQKLEIREGETPLAAWPFDTLRRVDAPEPELRLRSTAGAELARLIVTDPDLRAAIITHYPAIHSDDGGWALNRRIIWMSLAAAASVIALTIYGIPYLADRLAPLVPRSLEARMGQMVDAQFKSVFNAKACKSGDGQQAFAKLMAALEAKTEPGAFISGDVIASKVKNAVALPGGRVYLFRGLLDAADSPDEIAGVLAHELGHVKHRDALRQMVKTGGSSFLLGLLFGDVTGAGAVIYASRQLLTAAYSREAEFEADGAAIDAMRALGRPVKPMGELLTRVTGKENEATELLASHPLTQARMARFAKEDGGERGAPILDAGEWRALKGICAE